MKIERRKLTTGLAALAVMASASTFMGAQAQYQQAQYGSYPGYDSAPGMAPSAVNLPPSVTPGAIGAPAGALGAPGSGPPIGSMDYWKSFAANRLSPGSVLTGTLEDDVSSKHSKAGDIFAIVLDDGFSNQGKVVVPPGSRIIGTVTSATPAKGLKFGMPGNVQVALQSLALPDGRTGPISGFIEHNPNQLVADDPNKKTNDKSMPIGDYANSAKAMGYSVVTRMTRIAGVRYSPHAALKAGKDFEIKKGEVLAVKLNRPLDLASLTVPAGIPNGSSNGFPGGNPNAFAPAPNAVPGMIPPFGQQGAPHFNTPGSQAGLPNGEPF